MKDLVKLSFINELEVNLRSSNGLLQVVLGPRQVGKTTTVLHFLEQNFKSSYHYVSADKVFQNSSLWIRQEWARAFEQRALLVIDEIQKVENWAETMKSLWDEAKRKKQQVQCILLGSSSLEIQKGLTESLTGRFQLIKVHHWNFRESLEGYGLSFEEFLKFGGYPGAYELIKNNQDWISFVKTSIVETVIDKDILLNHTVKSPALFKQAFEMLSSYPAQEISFTKLLGQLQNKGNTDLIKHYLRLYEGAFLIKALDKFSSNKLKVKASSPKILPLAPAFYYLNIQDEYRGEERGRVFEALVGAQLVRTGHELYYWREKNDEVDFVLKRGRNLWAIEVKSGRRKNNHGLEKFKSHFPPATLVIIDQENYQVFEKDPLAFLSAI
jgi:uncharacterized protein